MGLLFKNAFVAVAVCALCAIVISSVDRVYAHGGGFQLTRREIAGPYELVLGTIPDPPVVGEAILILSVADPETGARVLNANVTVEPKGPGADAEPLRAGPDSYDPTLYETRVTLDAEGSWTFTISVTGQEGSGSATFGYDVKRASPIPGMITLAALLAFLTVLGLSVRAFIKDRGKRQRVGRRKA